MWRATQSTVRIFILIGCLIASFVSAQGTFQNLGFESTTIPPGTPPSMVSSSAAFPGWTAYFGSTPATTVSYNRYNLGTSGIGIDTTNAGVPYTFAPFEGRYTALLQGGLPSSNADVSLAQTGMIPIGTTSLHFLALSTRNNFIVSLGGQPIIISQLQDFGNYQEYGANIPSFAGQNVELRFTQPHGPTQSGDFFFDAISFSPVGIPEPGTWALLALGSGLFFCTKRRCKNR